MPTAPPPSTAHRLRTKTSDLSDLLHGRKSQSDLRDPPVPMPSLAGASAERVTFTKSKRMIDFTFLGRRRKSSASPSRKSHDGKTDNEEGVPPVPSLDASRLSTSNPPEARSSVALSTQSSNGSPQQPSPLPSSSGITQFVTSRIHSRTAASPPAIDASKSDPQKASSALPLPSLRHLRPQKSDSFEHTKRFAEARQSNDASSQASSSRPVITVSPPAMKDQHGSGIPRASQSPSPPSVSRTTRRQAAITGRPPQNVTTSRIQFTTPAAEYARACLGDEATTPTHTPTPPESPALGTDPKTKRTASARASPTPPPPTRPPKDRPQKSQVTFPLPLQRNRERTTSGLARKPSLGSSTALSDSDAGPSSVTSSTRSRIPATASALRQASGKVPPPLLTTFRRPPGTGPPTEPLPSPPTSDGLGSGDETSSSLSGLPTIPSFGTMARRSLAANPHRISPRERTTTLSTVASSKRESPIQHSSPPTDLSGAESDVNKPLPNIVAESGDENAATPEQLRSALNMQSTRFARLSAYLFQLTERHAAEKMELNRRIEDLEREAEKRETELKGLRWLVMQSGQGESDKGKTGTAKADAGASPSAGSEPGQPSSRGMMSMDSTGNMSMDSLLGSTEEGLMETQQFVSDFISPLSTRDTDPGADPSPNPSTLGVMGRSRRLNTTSDPSGLSPPTKSREKRLSAPTFPPSMSAPARVSNGSNRSVDLKSPPGLGIDLSSIPSIPGSSSGSSMTRSTSTSLPSLIATTTASTGLSVIPESPRPGDDFNIPAPGKDKRERRISGVLKRLSLTSTSSSGSKSSTQGSERRGPAAQNGERRLGASPSIGQVLDRAAESEPESVTRSQARSTAKSSRGPKTAS